MRGQSLVIRYCPPVWTVASCLQPDPLHARLCSASASCALRMVSSSFFPGILGAPPSMPLMTNPALSAALLQLALQNQTQAQQVLRQDTHGTAGKLLCVGLNNFLCLRLCICKAPVTSTIEHLEDTSKSVFTAPLGGGKYCRLGAKAPIGLFKNAPAACCSQE